MWMLLLLDRNFKLSSSRPELEFPGEDPEALGLPSSRLFFIPNARRNRLSVLATLE